MGSKGRTDLFQAEIKSGVKRTKVASSDADLYARHRILSKDPFFGKVNYLS